MGVTVSDESRQLEKLSDQQIRAVELLESGLTITATAAEIGVARQTVSEWRNNGFEFREELIERRKERYESSRWLREQIDRRAMDNVATSIAEGDVGASFRWLRLRGTTALEDPDSVAPSDLISDDEYHERVLDEIEAFLEEKKAAEEA